MLTKKDHTIREWSTLHDEGLKEIQLSIMLSLVPFVPGRPTVIWSDASPSGHSAWLAQVQPDGTLRAVDFFSRCWSKDELSSLKNDQNLREATGVTNSLLHWQSRIELLPFIVITDNKAINSLLGRAAAQPSSKYYRLHRTLLGFDFVLIFRDGDSNPADHGSRFQQGEDAGINLAAMILPDLNTPIEIDLEEKARTYFSTGSHHVQATRRERKVIQSRMALKEDDIYYDDFCIHL